MVPAGCSLPPVGADRDLVASCRRGLIGFSEGKARPAELRRHRLRLIVSVCGSAAQSD